METSESHSHERGSTTLAVTFEDEVATGNEVTVDPPCNCSGYCARSFLVLLAQEYSELVVVSEMMGPPFISHL